MALQGIGFGWANDMLQITGRTCQVETWTDTLLVCQHFSLGAPLNDKAAVPVRGRNEVAWWDLSTQVGGISHMYQWIDITSLDCGTEECFAQDLGVRHVTIQGSGFGWAAQISGVSFRGRQCDLTKWTDTSIECEDDTSISAVNNYLRVSTGWGEGIWDLVRGVHDNNTDRRAQIVSTSCGDSSCVGATGQQTVTLQASGIRAVNAFAVACYSLG